MIRSIFSFNKCSSLLVFLVVVAGCTADENVIKIGCSAPLTGDQAKIGSDLCNGVKLAVQNANAQGEILPGYTLKAALSDDQHNPTQAVNAASRFASDPSVMGVVGHLNSSATKPASAIYFEARIPQITPASTNPDLSKQGFDTFFRVCATDDVQGPAAARFIRLLGMKSVFIIDDKTTYGKGLADEFEKAARKLGFQILGHQGLTQGDKDFSPLLTSIKARNPDVIFFGGIYPEASLLIRQAKTQGITSLFFGGDGIADPILIRLATPAFAEGTYATRVGLDARKIPTAKQFVQEFETQFGEIGLYSSLAYDAANLLIEAIRQAGGRDREKVLRALREIKDFQGVTGSISFDENGDNLNKFISVYRVTNGEFEFIETIRS